MLVSIYLIVYSPSVRGRVAHLPSLTLWCVTMTSISGAPSTSLLGSGVLEPFEHAHWGEMESVCENYDDTEQRSHLEVGMQGRLWGVDNEVAKRETESLGVLVQNQRPGTLPSHAAPLSSRSGRHWRPRVVTG